MKTISFIIVLLLSVVTAFAQPRTSAFEVYGGIGCATKDNYDYGTSMGFGFYKGIQKATAIGLDIFAQSYSLYIDNEANSAKHQTGYAGFTLRHYSNYLFFAPKVVRNVKPNGKGFNKFHASAGIGMLISGYDSVCKWDHSNSSDPFYPGNYDSVINAKDNINKMVFRVSLGFTQYIRLGKGWWFTLTEDFGFLPFGLTKTGDQTNNSPSRTQYSPYKISPGYISLQLGLSRIRNCICLR